MAARRAGEWVLLAALLLGLAAWWWRDPGPQRGAMVVATPAAEGTAAVASTPEVPAQPASGTVSARPGLHADTAVAAKAVALPMPPAASRALRPGEFDVCGRGILQGQPVEPTAAGRPSEYVPPKELEDRWQQEVEALLPQLAASGRPGIEAAVALMQRRTADLVRVALRDRDARSVQWAMQACQAGSSPPSEPACQMLPPRLWTEVEPDNGAAWLQLMSAEPAAQADALYGLTRARRFDERVGALTAVVDAAAPSNLPPHLRMALQAQAFSTELGMTPAFKPLFQLCPANVALDANRREQCQAVAELLSTQSGTVLSRSLGLSLVERTGAWPTERIAERRRQLGQAKARMAERLDQALKQPLLSCAHLEVMGRYVSDVARQGEWATATQPPAPRR